MKVIIYIFKKFIASFYFVYKLKKLNNQITIISRQSNKASIDIMLLEEEIKSRNIDVKVVVLTRTIGSGILSKIFYVFYMIGPMLYNMAISKIVIVDGYCIPISLLKHRDELVVIQMWHAMGAFKKFAYSILDKEEGSSSKIANLMSMHKGYDYIFTSSKQSKQYLMEAYNYDSDKFITMSLPRVDLITNEVKSKQCIKDIYNKYPNLNNGKKNILYSPTFRKDNSIEHIYSLIEEVDNNKYNLIISPHVLMKDVIKTDKATIISEYESIKLLSISDYIITDYSAFIFEAVISKKPVYLYCPDIDKYNKERGFYIDLNNYFTYISKDSKDIIDYIENNKYDYKELDIFLNKYIENTTNTTKMFVDFIFNILSSRS